MKAYGAGWLVVLGAVWGCGGSAKTPQDAPVDTPADAPPDAALRTVSGTFDIHLINTAGTETLHANLSQQTITALVPPAFTPIQGSGTSNGTFSIPGVPVGTYYLHIGSRYFQLSADTVDLSFDALGRPTSGFATTPTDLTFDMTGLAAWQTTDELALFSPQTGTAAYAMQAAATAGAPAASDTSLTGFVYNLALAGQRALIDTTMGDQAVLTQLGTQTDGTRTYRTITRSFSPAALTVANGGSATVSGAFDTPTASATFDVMWDRPAFAAELAAHAPGSAPDNWSTLGLLALPDAIARGQYSDGPDIVVFAPGYQTDSTAIAASWSYADPYPADWTRIVMNRYYRYRFVQVGGASVALFAQMLAHRELSTVTSQAPLEPIVGVPVNPKINGTDASGVAVMSGIGSTPTISWSAPDLGTASRYYVTVQLVQVQGSNATLQSVATIETPDTQVTIPPAVLATGQTYVFSIGVRSVTGIDLAATPEKFSLPEGWGSVTTTAATP